MTSSRQRGRHVTGPGCFRFVPPVPYGYVCRASDRPTAVLVERDPNISDAQLAARTRTFATRQEADAARGASDAVREANAPVLSRHPWRGEWLTSTPPFQLLAYTLIPERAGYGNGFFTSDIATQGQRAYRNAILAVGTPLSLGLTALSAFLGWRRYKRTGRALGPALYLVGSTAATAYIGYYATMHPVSLR